MICPRCHYRIQPELTARQRQVLRAIRAEQASARQATAATAAVARRCWMSITSTKRVLSLLEHLGMVDRPQGPKSGWAVTDDAELPVQLTDRQQSILDAIRVITRSGYPTASTLSIATRLYVGETTAKRDLDWLEKIGLVHRPLGEKSGWALLTTDVAEIAA